MSPTAHRNLGEQNEVFLKAFITKHYRLAIPMPGAPEEIRMIEDIYFGPNVTVPEWSDEMEEALQTRNYEILKPIFGKAKNSFKADISINDVTYSIKYSKAANPAIVNHTARDGFLKVCRRTGADIAPLDYCIEEYWRLRMMGTIKEDIKNSDPNSPFRMKRTNLPGFCGIFCSAVRLQKIRILPRTSY